jgi:hypothetical protein
MSSKKSLRSDKKTKNPKRQIITPRIIAKRPSRPIRSKTCSHLQDSPVLTGKNLSPTESNLPPPSACHFPISLPQIWNSLSPKPKHLCVDAEKEHDLSSKRVILKLSSFQLKDDFQGPVVPSILEVEKVQKNNVISPKTTKRLLRKHSSRSLSDVSDVGDVIAVVKNEKSNSSAKPKSQVSPRQLSSNNSNIIDKSRQLLRKLSSCSLPKQFDGGDNVMDCGIVEKETTTIDETAAAAQKKLKSQEKQMRILGITDVAETTAAPSEYSLSILSTNLLCVL